MTGCRDSAIIIATMWTDHQAIADLKMRDFLSQHAVFTLGELDQFLSARGSSNPNTRKSLLTYHRNQGRVVPIRRGLYASVPVGGNPATSPVDPYLIAAKMRTDAVLAYHTALEFHGRAYSAFTRLHYFAAGKSVSLRFRGNEFVRVPIPQPLHTKGQERFGVLTRKYLGVELRVTSFERTFVDVLDRPELSGSWEEIWRSLESIEFFDLDQVVEYVFLLENATTAAKVGFFLEQHRENLMVEDAHLDRLRVLCPRQPHYLVRGKRNGCQCVKGWNLMVPLDILNGAWGEVL